jgi:uncharacterized protein YbjT (DUF2867 family)
MSCTIAVTGATGNVGGVLSGILLERGHGVRALGRDEGKLQSLVEKGAEARVGDIFDPDFVASSFDGADGVFLMIPPDPASDDQLGRAEKLTKNYVGAIRAGGVGHVVAMSSIGAHLEKGAGIVDTVRVLERELATLDGVNVRVLRPAYFMDNVYAQIDIIKNLGITGGPLGGDVKQPMVASRDVGAVAAELLDKRDFTGLSVEYVLGPADVSYNDVAAALGKAMGRGLKYLHVPDRDLRAALAQMGMSRSFIDMMLELSHSINNGDVMNAHTRTPENTTPTTIDEFAQWFAAAYNA